MAHTRRAALSAWEETRQVELRQQQQQATHVITSEQPTNVVRVCVALLFSYYADNIVTNRLVIESVAAWHEMIH